MTKEINATVIFDNGEGITLQLENTWAHYYGGYDGYVKHAAEDYKAYLDTGDTEGWEGHEEDALELDPSYDDIRNGGYRIFTDTDIADLLEQDEIDNWGNVEDFCEALKKLNK